MHKISYHHRQRTNLKNGQARGTVSLVRQHEGPNMIWKVEGRSTPMLWAVNTGN